jgi:hypothetical protein
LRTHVFDGRVHQCDVELTAGFDLGVCHRQAPPDHLRGLGPAARQPADKLVPRRRGKEHQQRVRHRAAHLPGTLDVDFKQ